MKRPPHDVTGSALPRPPHDVTDSARHQGLTVHAATYDVNNSIAPKFRFLIEMRAMIHLAAEKIGGGEAGKAKSMQQHESLETHIIQGVCDH